MLSKAHGRRHARRRAKPPNRNLQAQDWNPSTRAKLEQLIRDGTGKQLPVVFDFDNTIICGDISEATLAILVKSGLLKAARLPATLSPPFRPLGRKRITLQSSADPAEYYEAFLAPSAHGRADPSPLANGYVWAVEVMEGLRPLDVINATHAAFELSQPGRNVFIEVTPGRTAFPVPFFYPEMVELMAALLHHRFDVWIVSAGNVWSIRWMVQHALNPSLRRFGLAEGVRADHILGVSTLLTDKRDHLYKDELLVRENVGYAALDERTLGAFRLTSRLQFPVPTYSGKLACIFDAIGRSPYLYVGDSPGDHAMLEFSQNRLWIARLEKPAYQAAALELIRKTGRRGWMVQATLTLTAPGFVADLEEVSRRLGNVPAKIRQSLRLLSRLQNLAHPVSRKLAKGWPG